MDVQFLGFSPDMGWALGLSPGFGWVVQMVRMVGSSTSLLSFEGLFFLQCVHCAYVDVTFGWRPEMEDCGGDNDPARQSWTQRGHRLCFSNDLQTFLLMISYLSGYYSHCHYDLVSGWSPCFFCFLSLLSMLLRLLTMV